MKSTHSLIRALQVLRAGGKIFTDECREAHGIAGNSARNLERDPCDAGAARLDRLAIDAPLEQVFLNDLESLHLLI